MSRESRLIKKISPKPLGNNNFVLPNNSGVSDFVDKRGIEKISTDHIAEHTLGHEIVVDNNVTPATSGGANLGSASLSFGFTYSLGVIAINISTLNASIILLRVDHISEKTGAHGVVIDNILYANAIGIGLDVLHSAIIGNHLTVLNNLIVDGNLKLTGDNKHITVEGGGINVTAEIENEKTKITDDGGYAVLLKNETGINSVKGKLVMASTTVANAVDGVPANALNVVGSFLDSNVADHALAWVVVGGIALVIADSNGVEIGDRVIASSEAGEVAVSNSPDGPTHFREVGHALEAGEDNLIRIMMHFL